LKEKVSTQFRTGHQKEKSPQLSLRAFYVVVRLAGIEPTTPWFVAKYSIQLSYSRTACNYSPLFATFSGLPDHRRAVVTKEKSPEDKSSGLLKVGAAGRN
jgi:hypothetical protein